MASCFKEVKRGESGMCAQVLGLMFSPFEESHSTSCSFIEKSPRLLKSIVCFLSLAITKRVTSCVLTESLFLKVECQTSSNLTLQNRNELQS